MIPVYSLRGIDSHVHNSLNYSNCEPLKLTDAVPDTQCIYFFDWHEQMALGINFQNFLSDDHAKHVKRSKSLIIYHNTTEVNTGHDTIRGIKRYVTFFGIDPGQIIFLCRDEVDAKNIKEAHESHGVAGVVYIPFYRFYWGFNTEYSRDMLKFIQHKKFSTLCRTWRTSREYLFFELADRNLLRQHFNYTFTMVEPYGNIFSYTKQTIMNVAAEHHRYGNTESLSKIYSWILNDLPVTAEDLIVDYNKFHALRHTDLENTELYLIDNSDIHVIVEGLYDEPKFNHVPFISEKTHKAIALEKPFIMYGEKGTLAAVRELGLQTFSPYINESYDDIQDPEQRRIAVVDEIEKICNMPQDEYMDLVSNMKDITIKNKQIDYQNYLNAKSMDNVPDYAYGFKLSDIICPQAIGR